MIHSLLIQLSIFALPAFACEGQCIVEITRAFIGNYTTPIHNVFADAATKISTLILHSQSSEVAVSKIMQPLLNSYERNAYDAMEKAIFPSYFHGKCQVNGVDPAGCPNPDCPVVCGTPGSLVHFYPILQQIAFNTTTFNLLNLCVPSSRAYQAFETAVLREHCSKSRARRSLHSVQPGINRWPHIISRDPLDKRLENKEDVSGDTVKKNLKMVCQSMGQDLTSQCGGIASLSKCSWEKEMKAFILSFP